MSPWADELERKDAVIDDLRKRLEAAEQLAQSNEIAARSIQRHAQEVEGRLEKARTGITLSRALLNQADETMSRTSCLTQTERALRTLDDVLAALSAQNGEQS